MALVHVRVLLNIRDLTKPRQRRKREHQKAISLNERNNDSATLHVHHAFLYVSLPSLQNYDVKWPNFKFTWERERPRKETSRKIGYVTRFTVPERARFWDFFGCSWLSFVRIILSSFFVKFLFCRETVSRLVCSKTILTKWRLNINSSGRRKKRDRWLNIFIETLKTLCWGNWNRPYVYPF